jgi:hypothetical protein
MQEKPEWFSPINPALQGLAPQTCCRSCRASDNRLISVAQKNAADETNKL